MIDVVAACKGGVVDRSTPRSGVFSFVPRFFGFCFLSLRLSIDDSLGLVFVFADATGD